MPPSSPGLCNTACMPGMKPAKELAASKKAAFWRWSARGGALESQGHSSIFLARSSEFSVSDLKMCWFIQGFLAACDPMGRPLNHLVRRYGGIAEESMLLRRVAQEGG